MANPAIIVCPANTWKKVASGVTSGVVTPFIENVRYSQTYRVASDPVPTDLSDAVYFGEPHLISSSSAIDVYIYAHNKAGSVRVDL